MNRLREVAVSRTTIAIRKPRSVKRPAASRPINTPARVAGASEAVSLRVSHVIKKIVLTAGQRTDFFHIIADNARYLEIVRIGCLSALKINIGILRRAPQFGPFRIGTTGAEFGHGLKVCQFGHVIIIDDGNFLDFV